MATETKNQNIDALLVESEQQSNTKRCIHNKLLWGIIILIIIVVVIIIIVIYAVQSSESSTDYESLFLSIPSKQSIMSNSQHFSRHPHNWGSIQNYIYAQDICERMILYGFICTYFNYSITLSHYVSSSMDLLNSTTLESIHSFNLSENIEPKDNTSNNPMRHQAWFGWGKPGNITGNLLYLNFGARRDYELLQNNYSFDFTDYDYIAIAKYGGGLSRHNKVRFAQLYGMKGIILYGDPLNYGINRGELFPDGPWLPPTGYQRGSSAFTVFCIGPIEPDRLLEKCNLTQDEYLPQIPGIPLSYDNAYRVMSKMKGFNMENISNWQGGMNFSYYTGVQANDNNLEDQVTVNIKVNTSLDLPESGNITHVISHIKGEKYPDESIFIGNHRDAWIFGAADPISGTTVILEIAKAFQAIMDEGWEPKRNIYIGSWDAEELSVIGSTTYVEDQAEWILDEVVAYLNIDQYNGRNPSMRCDPLFGVLMKQYMDRFTQPYNNSLTVLEKWKSLGSNQDRYINPLGYGSDYSSWVHNLGITSLHTGYSGLGGTYHTVYDSFYYMNIIDPDREIAIFQARFLGLIAFTMANEDLLPFNVTNLVGVIVNEYIPDIEQLSVEWNCTLIANETKDQFVSDVYAFGLAAAEFDVAVTILKEDGADGDDEYEEKVVKYNEAMRTLTRQFIYEPGLPERLFYKNLLTANDIEAGYSPQTLPYIAYAIKYDCNVGRIEEAYNVTAQAMLKAAAHLRDALM